MVDLIKVLSFPTYIFQIHLFLKQLELVRVWSLSLKFMKVRSQKKVFWDDFFQLLNFFALFSWSVYCPYYNKVILWCIGGVWLNDKLFVTFLLFWKTLMLSRNNIDGTKSLRNATIVCTYKGSMFSRCGLFSENLTVNNVHIYWKSTFSLLPIVSCCPYWV